MASTSRDAPLPDAAGEEAGYAQPTSTAQPSAPMTRRTRRPKAHTDMVDVDAVDARGGGWAVRGGGDTQQEVRPRASGPARGGGIARGRRGRGGAVTGRGRFALVADAGERAADDDIGAAEAPAVHEAGETGDDDDDGNDGDHDDEEEEEWKEELERGAVRSVHDSMSSDGSDGTFGEPPAPRRGAGRGAGRGTGRGAGRGGRAGGRVGSSIPRGRGTRGRGRGGRAPPRKLATMQRRGGRHPGESSSDSSVEGDVESQEESEDEAGDSHDGKPDPDPCPTVSNSVVEMLRGITAREIRGAAEGLETLIAADGFEVVDSYTAISTLMEPIAQALHSGIKHAYYQLISEALSLEQTRIELWTLVAAGVYGESPGALRDDAQRNPDWPAFLPMRHNPVDVSEGIAAALESLATHTNGPGSARRRYGTTPRLLKDMLEAATKGFREILVRIVRQGGYPDDTGWLTGIGLDDLQLSMSGLQARLIGLMRRYIQLKRSRHGIAAHVVGTAVLRLPFLLCVVTRDMLDSKTSTADAIVAGMDAVLQELGIYASELIIDGDREYVAAVRALHERGMQFVRTCKLGGARNFQTPFGVKVPPSAAHAVLGLPLDGPEITLSHKGSNGTTFIAFRQSSNTKTKDKSARLPVLNTSLSLYDVWTLETTGPSSDLFEGSGDRTATMAVLAAKSRMLYFQHAKVLLTDVRTAPWRVARQGGVSSTSAVEVVRVHHDAVLRGKLTGVDDELLGCKVRLATDEEMETWLQLPPAERHDFDDDGTLVLSARALAVARAHLDFLVRVYYKSEVELPAALVPVAGSNVETAKTSQLQTAIAYLKKTLKTDFPSDTARRARAARPVPRAKRGRPAVGASSSPRATSATQASSATQATSVSQDTVEPQDSQDAVEVPDGDEDALELVKRARQLMYRTTLPERLLPTLSRSFPGTRATETGLYEEPMVLKMVEERLSHAFEFLSGGRQTHLVVDTGGVGLAEHPTFPGMMSTPDGHATLYVFERDESLGGGELSAAVRDGGRSQGHEDDDESGTEYAANRAGVDGAAEGATTTSPRRGSAVDDEDGEMYSAVEEDGVGGGNEGATTTASGPALGAQTAEDPHTEEVRRAYANILRAMGVRERYSPVQLTVEVKALSSDAKIAELHDALRTHRARMMRATSLADDLSRPNADATMHPINASRGGVFKLDVRYNMTDEDMELWRELSVGEGGYMLQSMHHAAAQPPVNRTLFAVADAIKRHLLHSLVLCYPPHTSDPVAAAKLDLLGAESGAEPGDSDVLGTHAFVMSLASRMNWAWALPLSTGDDVRTVGRGALPAKYEERRLEYLAHYRLVQAVLEFARSGKALGAVLRFKPAAVVCHNLLKNTTDVLKREAKSVRAPVVGQTPLAQILRELVAVVVTGATRAYRAWTVAKRAAKRKEDLDDVLRDALIDRLNGLGSTKTLVLEALRLRELSLGGGPRTALTPRFASNERATLTVLEAIAVAKGERDITPAELEAAQRVGDMSPHSPAFWKRCLSVLPVMQRSTDKLALFERNATLGVLRLSSRFIKHVPVKVTGAFRCILDCSSCKDGECRERNAPQTSWFCALCLVPLSLAARDHFGGRHAFDVFHDEERLPKHPFGGAGGAASWSAPFLIGAQASLTDSVRRKRSNRGGDVTAAAHAASPVRRLDLDGEEAE